MSRKNKRLGCSQCEYIYVSKKLKPIIKKIQKDLQKEQYKRYGKKGAHVDLTYASDKLATYFNQLDTESKFKRFVRGIIRW